MNNNTALARTDSSQLDERRVEAQRQIMTQATPPHEIRARPGRGGKPLKYTDGAYVIRTLNEAFGWDWDFVADNEELLLNNGEPFEVKVRGTLTVRLNGQAVTKTQFGCQPIEMLSNGSKPVSIGDAYKGAATDAMKKCASLLGIALDLYDSDSDVNTGKKAPAHVPPQPPPGRTYEKPATPPRQPEPEVYEAEPTRPAAGAPLPRLTGVAGQIVALMTQLKWDGRMLANEIQRRFSLSVSEDVALAIDALNKQQQMALAQALKGELEGRQKAAGR